MEEILNYIKINDNISTSGQPSALEFESIAKSGFDVVINLALSNASNALENEDKCVSELGMTFIHIPVDFEEPTVKDLKIFLTLLYSLMTSGKKIWIHCAKNYRVSIFMYVYHKYILNTPIDKVDMRVFQEWTPSPKWQELMKVDMASLQN